MAAGITWHLQLAMSIALLGTIISCESRNQEALSPEEVSARKKLLDDKVRYEKNVSTGVNIDSKGAAVGRTTAVGSAAPQGSPGISTIFLYGREHVLTASSRKVGYLNKRTDFKLFDACTSALGTQIHAPASTRYERGYDRYIRIDGADLYWASVSVELPNKSEKHMNKEYECYVFPDGVVYAVNELH